MLTSDRRYPSLMLEGRRERTMEQRGEEKVSKQGYFEEGKMYFYCSIQLLSWGCAVAFVTLR